MGWSRVAAVASAVALGLASWNCGESCGGVACPPNVRFSIPLEMTAADLATLLITECYRGACIDLALNPQFIAPGAPPPEVVGFSPPNLHFFPFSPQVCEVTARAGGGWILDAEFSSVDGTVRDGDEVAVRVIRRDRLASLPESSEATVRLPADASATSRDAGGGSGRPPEATTLADVHRFIRYGKIDAVGCEPDTCTTTKEYFESGSASGATCGPSCAGPVGVRIRAHAPRVGGFVTLCRNTTCATDTMAWSLAVTGNDDHLVPAGFVGQIVATTSDQKTYDFDLQLDEFPDELADGDRYKLVIGGQTIFDTQIDHYVETRQNGPECDPYPCRYADVDLREQK